MAVIVAGNNYRFKSKLDNRYLNILTDGALSNNKNVTTYALDSTDLGQVWLASVYSHGSTIQYLLKSAKNNSFALDRWRGSSNYNNADIYTIGTTTEDLKDQVVVFIASGSYYKIKLANYDLYLTVTSTSTYGGYNVNWQTATGKDNQLWMAEPYTAGTSTGTSKSLSMPTNVNQWYSGYNSDIRYYGCALCSGVDVSSFFGTSSNNNANYFYNNYWTDGVGYTWGAPNATFTETTYSLSKIKSEIDAGRPVIVHATIGNNQHWVVAFGYTNSAASAGDISVLDPYNPDTSSTTGRIMKMTDAMARVGSSYTFDRMKLTAKK